MKDKIAEYRKELNQCFDELDPVVLERIVIAMLGRGRTIFIIGNGGSASTASHMAIDLTKGTQVEGGHRLRVISLTDNVAALTAWANDSSYNDVFTEQLKVLAKRDDILIAISVSGHSENVIEAVSWANKHGVGTIGFIGNDGGELKTLVDADITVSSRNYGVVEDFHLSLGHILSQFIRKHIEGGEHWKHPSSSPAPVDTSVNTLSSTCWTDPHRILDLCNVTLKADRTSL